MLDQIIEDAGHIIDAGGVAVIIGGAVFAAWAPTAASLSAPEGLICAGAVP
jgi:hypothetical protein